MELKLKQLKSTSKLDYNGYKKLAKATWENLLTVTAPTGYALVAGQYLFWKNTKTALLPKQPLLYVGPTTKWKMELNGHAEMPLQDYSYGTCKVTKKGAHIYIALLPIKGKLTQEKLLKPLQKELKKFKPKVFLEVVSAFEKEEELQAVVNITTEENTIAVLAEKLECLLALHTAIDGDYKGWVKDVDAYKTAYKYIKTAQSFLAPTTQSNAALFFEEYQQLRGVERAPYKELAKLAKNYKKIKPFVQQWFDTVQLGKMLEVKRIDIQAAKNALGINNSEDDLVLISREKTAEIKALIQEFKTYKKDLKQLPSYLSKRQSKLLKFADDHLNVLYLALERTTENLEDPTIQPKKHPGHNYMLKKINGKLFDRPQEDKEEPLIADNDVLQGSLGDCYLMASLIGLAKKYPTIIRNAIEEKKTGNNVTYAVTLYLLDPEDNKKLVPQKVYIDNQFMVDSAGESAYAAQGDQGELWPLVIEKAMAKVLGSYEDLAGGNTETVLRMLSGQFPEEAKIQGEQPAGQSEVKITTKEEIIQLLKDNREKLITVSIKTPEESRAGLFVLEGVGESENLTESKSMKFNGDIIYCNHAYVIKDVDYDKLEKAGDTDEVITLHNPHNVEASTKEKYKNKKFPKVSPMFLKYCAVKITAL
ncbi:MAG: C2 family cysteine protease [Aureispira sp.]